MREPRRSKTWSRLRSQKYEYVPLPPDAWAFKRKRFPGSPTYGPPLFTRNVVPAWEEAAAQVKAGKHKSDMHESIKLQTRARCPERPEGEVKRFKGCGFMDSDSGRTK